MAASPEQPNIAETIQNKIDSRMSQLKLNNKTERTPTSDSLDTELDVSMNKILSPVNIDREGSIGDLKRPSINGVSIVIPFTPTVLSPENELSFEYSNNLDSNYITPLHSPRPTYMNRHNIGTNNDTKHKYKTENKTEECNTNIFWRPICPFSVSDRFKTVNNKICAYLYRLVVTPEAYTTKFGLLTPKTISKTLELPYISFKIHYREYIRLSNMSSNVRLNEMNKYEFTDNKWQWILEFNKIVFEILYPNLSNWHYSIEEIQSFELRNYLILPLVDSTDNDFGIDWNLIEDIVKYFYSKHNMAYDMRQLLTDLGLIGTEEQIHCSISDTVLCENGKYFVPLHASKQRIIPYLRQMIDAYNEEKALNEMNELLREDSENRPMNSENIDIYSPKMDNEMDDIDIMIDSIENRLYSRNEQLQLLSLRFDKMDHFIGNITESKSLIYNKTQNRHKQWIIEPRIDYIPTNRNGLFKLPFTAHFMYALMRMPFICFQFERIFRITQFIQSQQYLSKPIHFKKRKGYLDSFLMKIPLLTLSKIIFQKEISVPFNGLFKEVGQQLLTLTYSTSSMLLLLVSDSDSDSANMIDITTDLMNNSLKIFRKTLESSQIIHYFSPSHFRNGYFVPPRFHNISLHEQNDSKTLLNQYYKFISETAVGHNINEYIARLLYPVSSDKQSMQISNKYLFSIQNNLFSSIWYYNYGKINKLNINEIVLDCNNVINWMKIDKILNISSQKLQKLTKHYKQKSIPPLNHDRSLLKTIPKTPVANDAKTEEKNDETLIESTSLFAQLNPETQSIICKFVRNIEYEFEYPPILICLIDPFFILRTKQKSRPLYDKLTFELLYDMGNIVLNLVITLSVATNCYHSLQNKNKNKTQNQLPYQKLKGMKKLLFYKKCLTSNKYLTHKCRFHRLYKHIITNKDNTVSEELISAFMFAIIGAVYLDSNLSALEGILLNKAETPSHKLVSNVNGIHLQNVWDFIERFMPEVTFEEDIKHIIHLLRKNNPTQNSHKQNIIKRRVSQIQQMQRMQQIQTQRQQMQRPIHKPNYRNMHHQNRRNLAKNGISNAYSQKRNVPMRNGYVKRSNTIPNVNKNGYRNAHLNGNQHMTFTNHRHK